MVDWTLCVSEICPLADGCYRYRANPSGDDMQSYADFTTYIIAGPNGYECYMFVQAYRKHE